MFDHGQNYGPEYPYDPDSASYPDEASQNNSFDRPHFGDAEAFGQSPPTTSYTFAADLDSTP